MSCISSESSESSSLFSCYCLSLQCSEARPETAVPVAEGSSPSQDQITVSQSPGVRMMGDKVDMAPRYASVCGQQGALNLKSR